MATKNRGSRRRMLSELSGLRPLSLALAFLALFLVAPTLFAEAHAVKLKDGSLVFARAPYAVKGTRAIITLENGTVTQIPLDEVDVPGTEKYNRENFGNAIAIHTPHENVIQLPVRAPQSRVVSSVDSPQSAGPALWGGPAVRGSRRPPR